MNKSFRNINELTTFSRCVCLPVIPLNTQNMSDFSCWLPDEIMRLLHGCTSYLDALSSLVFRVNFFGIFQFFSKALNHSASRHCSELFHLVSLALTRFSSRHCSVFSTISLPYTGPRPLFCYFFRHIFGC